MHKITSDLSKINISKLSISVFFESKSRSSFCWQYFGNLVLNDGNKKKILNSDQIFCSACLSAVKIESEDVSFGSVKIKTYNKTVSTGNLIRHLREDHKIKEEPTSREKVKSNKRDVSSVKHPAKSNSTVSSTKETVKHDKYDLARDLALWFCKSLLPFDSLSDEGMVDFFKKYNIIVNDDDLPTSYTVGRSALDDLYKSTLRNVKETILLDAGQHMAMSFDLWTDKYRRFNYITFTLHYLTSDFELKSLTLGTRNIDGEASGEKIESIIKDIRKKFKLKNKKIYAVSNSGENIKSAVTLANLDQHLCLGHGLHNLVTVDGIMKVPEIEALVKKCKNIVKTIRYHLPQVEADAERVQKEFLISLDSLIQTIEDDESEPIPDLIKSETVGEIYEEVDEKDPLRTLIENSNYINSITTAVPTRWHIVLDMLESLNHFCNRDPINIILRKIGLSELRISESDWNLLEDVVKFLKRFREAVEIVSSLNTCTINVALVFRSEIIDIVNSVSDEDSKIMCRLKISMLDNINKRFPVTREIVAAALLDNRFMGLKEVDSYLSSRNMTRPSFLVSYINEIITASEAAESNDVLMEPTPSTSCSSKETLLRKLSQKHSASTCESVQGDAIDQECWRYLASIDYTEPKDGNLLSYWNSRKNTYPRISALAKAILCIPATSISSERIFSVAGLIISAKRSRLNPIRVNEIMFIHDNYKLCK